MTTTMVKSSFLSFRVTEELREQLERVARANERSVAGEARLALKVHLDQAADTKEE